MHNMNNISYANSSQNINKFEDLYLTETERLDRSQRGL